MKGICVPCYDLMARLLPTTAPLIHAARYNLEKWTEQAEAEESKRNAAK